MKIVVIGTSLIDIKGFPEQPSALKGRSLGRIEYVHGGVGRNIAEDIGRMGQEVIFVSSVDDTPMGMAVKERLTQHKVNTQYLLTAPNGMGTWLALFDARGEVASSVCSRPNTQILYDILQKEGEQIISDCDAVIFELDLHRDVIKKIFELTETYQKKTYAVVSNIKLAMQERRFFEKTDAFICNLQEAEVLFSDNYTGKSQREIRACLKEQMISAKMKTIVVTLGERGTVYIEDTGTTGYIPAEDVVVKDTTGAGDAFCAGMVVALTDGKSMEDAVRIGNKFAETVISGYENVGQI